MFVFLNKFQFPSTNQDQQLSDVRASAGFKKGSEVSPTSILPVAET
jgi:hypothetical protein